MKPKTTIMISNCKFCKSGLLTAPKASFKSFAVAAFALTFAAGTDLALGDLVALYRFQGSAVADIAGSQKAGTFAGQAFDGTGSGSYSLSPDVAPGSGALGSLALNGGYIDLPKSLSAVNPFRGSGTIGGNQGRDFTITCWFKTANSGILLSSARDDTPANHAFAMFVDGGSLVADYFYINECRQGAAASNGSWHFGVASFQKSNNTWTVTLDNGSSQLVQYNDIPNAQDDTIRIGGSRNFTFPQPNAFIGSVSDVAIFNTVLTPAELAVVKAGDFSAYLTTPAGPASTNDSLTIGEDMPSLLATSDFGTYSDPGSLPLAAVKIISLPSAGSLEYDSTGSGGWTAVTADQEISAAHITSGRLRFSPAPEENGSPYTFTTFRVGNGSLFSGTYSLFVNVTPFNDYNPTGADRTVGIAQGGFKNLKAPTFGFADADGNDTLQKVKITRLPTAGSLTLSAAPVTLNQEISVADLNAGNLRFTPVATASGPAYATFGFQVFDGSLYSTVDYFITIDLLEVGVTHRASRIPFDNLGALVGARVFGAPGTYDGIPFALWTGGRPGSETIATGVTADIISFSPDAPGLGGGQQYGTPLYTFGNDLGGLKISGLDAQKTYQIQIGFSDLREGLYPYSVDAPITLSDGSSATVPLAIGALTIDDDFARISARVTGTTSFRLDLPTAQNGVGPIIAGFSVHEFTTYSTWASANGASSNPGDDSNNNGVPNAIEFFMGATPGNPATLPALVDTADTWSWTLPYEPTASAIAKFQSSGDLLGWSDALPGEVQFLTSPNRIKFTLPVGTGRKFCRLNVTPTP